MAEAAAALEFAAAITAFIGLGVTWIKRLKQFHNVDDAPEAFRSVKTESPLSRYLERTSAQANGGHLSVSTTEALTPLVEGCLDQVRYLDDRLDRLLPSRNDN
jgi:N-terminal domain on NACHT_NTPase and P-loop NTPases